MDTCIHVHCNGVQRLECAMIPLWWTSVRAIWWFVVGSVEVPSSERIPRFVVSSVQLSASEGISHCLIAYRTFCALVIFLSSCPTNRYCSFPSLVNF